MLRLKIEQHRRGGRDLLKEIELSFPAGQFSVILGPNGAGKTTLLKLISGQEPVQRGSVTLADQPLAQIDLLQRARQMAMLTQEHPLNFPFTALDVVKMGCHPLGISPDEAEEKARHLLTVMELAELSKRNYLTLSGGEKQRVQLARVLAQLGEESQVLLLDEPLSGMDLRHQHLTLAYLRAQAKQGLTVIAVLHDPVLAARYADRLVLLKQGRLSAEGKVDEVWQSDTLSALYDLPLQVSLENGEPQLHTADLPDLNDNLFGAQPRQD